MTARLVQIFGPEFGGAFQRWALVDDPSLDLGPDLSPPNATPLEAALARLSGYADHIDASVIETIWNAWRCPAPLLPHFAWAMSVDAWDEAWPEIVRRQAIADSPEHHRRKGTRGAVDRALALVAPPEAIAITEWWERTPPGRRGTSRVHIEADLDAVAATLAKARPLIAGAKPKSRPVVIGAGDRVTGVATLASALVGEEIVSVEPYAFGVEWPEGAAAIGWGALVEETITVGAA